MKKHLIQMVLMLAGCCAPGQGIFVYDQQVSNTSPPGGYYNIQPGPTGQSFVPSLSSVGFVQFYFSDSDPNRANETVSVYVDLFSGSLTNGNLVSTTDTLSLSGNFFGETNFLFSTPAAVVSGTTYYFQVVAQSGIGEVIGAGSDYANGTAFFQGMAQPGSDLWFREGVIAVPEPSVSLLAVLGIAGLYFHRRRNH